MSVVRRYFGTDGIRGRTGVMPITAEFCLKLGWAAGQVLAREGKGSVVIGKDTRLSGYMLVSALESGFISAGLDVKLLGPMPTPGVAYLARALGADAGVVVSASHNPYYDNGVKFFSFEGKKLPDDLEHQIEAQLALPMTTAEPMNIGRATLLQDARKRYQDFCVHTFQSTRNLSHLHIVVDCAHGATYHIAPEVFRELGAKVTTLHCEPNGLNINETCGSTHPEALQREVLAQKADLGIAFDGDGDRIIFVDHVGEIVDGDQLLFIMAMAYQSRGELVGGVVGTQMSNLGLEKALEKKQIPFIRTQVGDRYVMEGLQKMGWRLGGESSGHLICLDRTTTGDGIIAALQVLAYLGDTEQPLHHAKQGMIKCAQVLLNVPVNNAPSMMQDPRVLAVSDQATKTLENKGRILLRPSGTEPLMRIMVEGEDHALIQSVAESMAAVVTEVAAQGAAFHQPPPNA